jgi:hypothetical protein
MERQQLETAVVDLDVQLIDDRVAAQDLLELRVIALYDGTHGGADAILGEPAHLEQPRLQLLELFLEVPDVVLGGHAAFAYPNRPVT